jgi:2-oxoglutarate ferredoxin oxidoreductase subunit beta
MQPEIYQDDVENQWCPGCSNFGILAAMKKALATLGLAPHEVCLVSGIGQAAKLPHYLRANVFNGLHGRAIPAATGIKVANPHLTVIVTTGDGDCYGEGGNHLLHALRRNPDITLVVHNNEVYALTKGQGSPTTPIGERTRLQFGGVEIEPIAILATAIVQGCGFVARGYAGEIDHLSDLIVRAARHRGLSLVDVVQPCLTWGSRPLSWYREHVVKLGTDHDPHDHAAALELATQSRGTIPIGVLYEAPPGRIFAERYREKTGGRPLAVLELLDESDIALRLARFSS